MFKFQAAIEACKILKGRLSEVKEKVGAKATWLEIVQAANKASPDLDTCKFFFHIFQFVIVF